MSAFLDPVSPCSVQRFRVSLSSPQAVAEVTAVLWRPERDAGGPVVILGHGAGADVTSRVLCAVGRGLAARGHPVAAFNFPYAEAGRRRPDSRARLETAFRDVVAAVRDRVGTTRPLVLGGRSMGGRIATLLAAGDACEGVHGLLLLAYPLHPAGRRERLRTEHWPALRVPLLFIQGDRDAMCDLALFERERRTRLGQVDTRVHVLAGVDHGYGVRKGGGRDRGAVLAEVVDTAGNWLDGLVPAAERIREPAAARVRS